MKGSQLIIPKGINCYFYSLFMSKIADKLKRVKDNITAACSKSRQRPFGNKTGGGYEIGEIASIRRGYSARVVSIWARTAFSS